MIKIAVESTEAYATEVKKETTMLDEMMKIFDKFIKKEPGESTEPTEPKKLQITLELRANNK